MILGIYEVGQSAQTLTETVQAAVSETASAQIWADKDVALAWFPTHITSLDEPAQPYHSDQTVSVFEGKLYNLAEIQSQVESDVVFSPERSGQAIGQLYEQRSDDFLAKVNGKFSFALWDRQSRSLVLGRDRLGIQSLFYASNGKRLVFSSSLKLLLKVPGVSKTLNHQAVVDYLLYCYNPSDDTFFKDIYKLPASQLLTASDRGVTLQPYWRLSFTEVTPKSEAQYCEEIPALIKDAVKIRLEPTPPGVLLSGGIDSSTMVSLSSQMSDQPLSTFSFRCEGKSYDESQYARLVANRFDTEHTEVPYGPDQIARMTEVVAAMDEPFCDIGIEMATFLLGQTAQGKVSYVFSGEGGDELFGGHPAYTADKAAEYVDWIPKPLLKPLTEALQKLPDSDRKKNLQVKLKRVAYSLGFPPKLLSHRWRVYYKPEELKQLCTEKLLGNDSLLAEETRLFDSMLKHTQVEGPDILSRCLSSDYWTLVNFYLRRLELLRPFGIENRLPLLDHRLIEYAAKIPSNLKLRGFSDTKYIYKQALRGILPDKILFDRPKLGHSVPMKNWMRQQPVVKDWICEILTSDSFNRRGFFKPDFVQQLLEEHLNKTHNHSHRLWALTVLELWCCTNLDNP